MLCWRAGLDVLYRKHKVVYGDDDAIAVVHGSTTMVGGPAAGELHATVTTLINKVGTGIHSGTVALSMKLRVQGTTSTHLPSAQS